MSIIVLAQNVDGVRLLPLAILVVICGGGVGLIAIALSISSRTRAIGMTLGLLAVCLGLMVALLFLASHGGDVARAMSQVARSPGTLLFEAVPIVPGLVAIGIGWFRDRGG